MNVTRLAGHTLPNEGRITVNGYRTNQGPAVCSCGWTSADLFSDTSRRDAHRQHKQDVATAGRQP
ncbi:hypothetical protein [Actinoplanes rectilineatus]|uniref:hypothetical protein n=1 Tax=Actinoplanes rectilineatus TaxID=113571 RepID=UPI0005F2E7EF|nr:hypothetical protein [Actinoplanes rectilineatus]